MGERGVERMCDLVITDDLPTEAEMADDGGCAAFLADTVRRERPGGGGVRRTAQPQTRDAPAAGDEPGVGRALDRGDDEAQRHR